MKLNNAQNEVLAALKSGATLRQSNRNDVASGKVHHATVKALVNAGAVVLNADKTLSLTASEEHASKSEKKANGKASGRAALVEALAFATERVATCERMVKNGTCTRERLAQWVRKVEALTAELAAW